MLCRKWFVLARVTIPLMATGCGSTGWLPSLSLSMAAIRQSHAQETETEREFRLRANANLSWRLRSISRGEEKIPVGHDETMANHGYQPCLAGELCQWETRERRRAYQAATREGI
jgi:hypothetical protein